MGFILRIPDVFVFGNWVAIIIAIVFMGAYSRRVSSEMQLDVRCAGWRPRWRWRASRS